MATETDVTKQIVAINPANRQVLGTVEISSAAQIEETVRRAQQAFALWRRTSVAERLRLVDSFRILLFKRQDEISQLITSECGKPRMEALVADIFGVLETAVWLQENAPAILQARPVRLNPIFFPGKRSYNVQEPLGVVAVIAPFNYPFSIPVATMLAALVAGNAVVLKPSPQTALVAAMAVDLFIEAGFPVDLVGLVQGYRQEAEALVQAPIARVMFTGSVAAGKSIMALAAGKLLPLTLELGGKHAAIVLADCDLDAIARPLVWAAFTNGGQACASIERLYVVQSIAPALVERVTALTAGLALGDGLLPDVDVGPLLDEGSVKRMQELVADAVAKGAVVKTGGKARPDLGGYFFEPTVLTGVTENMDVVKKEIFGPLLPIVEVADAPEAIVLANASNLGLGASIWSKNIAYAEQLARQLQAGSVWINDGLFTHVAPDAPWGGIKDSGFGKMHSAAELKDLVYTKNISVNAQGAQDWNYPYNQAALNYLSAGLQVVHGSGFVSKVNGVLKVLQALWQKSRT